MYQDVVVLASQVLDISESADFNIKSRELQLLPQTYITLRDRYASREYAFDVLNFWMDE